MEKDCLKLTFSLFLSLSPAIFFVFMMMIIVVWFYRYINFLYARMVMLMDIMWHVYYKVGTEKHWKLKRFMNIWDLFIFSKDIWVIYCSCPSPPGRGIAVTNENMNIIRSKIWKRTKNKTKRKKERKNEKTKSHEE